MPKGVPVQQAWQWLLPPVVEDEQGRLIPRKRLAEQGRLLASENAAQSALDLEPNLPLTQINSVEDAIELKASETALLVHPGANHLAQLQGKGVAYLLRRSARRSIGFSVSAQGLEVTAPQWVAMGEIESALQTKSDWIVRKLHEAGRRQLKKDEARIHWQDGGLLDYLGKSMVLRLMGDGAQPLLTRQAHREQALDGSQSLHLPLLPGATAAQVKASVQAWILREARSHFTARMLHYAPLMGVRWNALRLTSAATRWGSATSAGVIRLNWRLMQHELKIIDYVVVHELAHLHHMDHSPKFWAVVAEVLPDWKQLRKILREKPLPAWE